MIPYTAYSVQKGKNAYELAWVTDHRAWGNWNTLPCERQKDLCFYKHYEAK